MTSSPYYDIKPWGTLYCDPARPDGPHLVLPRGIEFYGLPHVLWVTGVTLSIKAEGRIYVTEVIDGISKVREL